MIPTGPVYVLDSQDSYSCSMTTAFHEERIKQGNATVRVYVKEVNSTASFRFVTEHRTNWVRDSVRFQLITVYIFVKF